MVAYHVYLKAEISLKENYQDFFDEADILRELMRDTQSLLEPAYV